MTILTPEQVQEIEERWKERGGIYTHDIARLIASHRAVVDERDMLADGLSISEGLRKWSMQQLEQSQAEATRLRAVGVRQGGDIANDHSCKKDYGLCNCPRCIMLECEAEAARLEASASVHTSDAPVAGYPPSRTPASE